MRKIVLIGILALGIAAPASAQNLSAIDELIAPYVGSETPGMAVLVTGQGEVQHMAGYGYADLDTQTPVTVDSLFDLASASKQITALAAQLLIEQELFEVTTPVAALLPVFAGYGADARLITVGDLIYHLSGLPDYLDETLFDFGPSTSNLEIVDWLAQAEPATMPGVSFDYSNSGYVTLGSLVAAADNEATLQDVLQQRIWSVLGMAQTRLGSPVTAAAQVRGYAGVDGAFDPSGFYPSPSDPTVEGDGTVYSSVADLAKYEQALATGSLLGADAMSALFIDGQLDDGATIADEEGEGYGFGWNLVTVNGETIAYHGGSWTGTATVYLRNLDTGTSVVILANGEDFDPRDLAFEIAQAVDG